ncbi:MAG: hypothetical protein KDD10_00820, partial [Phaeodactylibacter sp.]|nr:hypothetical protein [Phaeodactylibacter sp.]
PRYLVPTALVASRHHSPLLIFWSWVKSVEISVANGERTSRACPGFCRGPLDRSTDLTHDQYLKLNKVARPKRKALRHAGLSERTLKRNTLK